MSDHRKRDLFYAEILKANSLSPSEKFKLLCEANCNKESENAEENFKKIHEFNGIHKSSKIYHLKIDKTGDINNYANPEESFVEDVRNSDILDAIILNGDSRLLEMLLDKNINLSHSFGNHLLHVATEKNKIEFVELLLNRGADVNIRNSEDMTPLHVAAMKGFLTIAKELLDNGANVNSTTYDLKKHNNKICNKAENANERIMKRLLTRPFETFSEDDITFAYGKLKTKEKWDGSSIFFAVQNADVEMTKLLLSRGADIPHNPNVLINVINSGNLDIIECFTNRNIDINGKGEEEETALHRAVLASHCEEHKVEIIKLLISGGACVNSRNKNQQTPLHLAAQNGYAKLVETLLEYNPDVENSRRSEDILSEFSLTTGNEFTSKKIATQLINENKIDETQVCVSGQKDYEKFPETLLKFKANKRNFGNLKNSSTRLSFFQASKIAFDYKSVQLHAQNHIGETSLHLASSRNHPEVVEILLKHGIDIDCKTFFGKTAIDVAFENGCRQAFIVLLNYGSNIDIAYNADIFDRNRSNFCLIKSHRGEFIISNMYCVESIRKHIVRIKTAERFVSKGNSNCLANNDGMLNSYYRECNEEIETMKRQQIGSNISLYDVLIKSAKQLAGYARNERLIQALESKDLKDKFPIYSNMILYNLKRAQGRDLLINISLNLFNILIEYYLPPEVVVTDIFKYLENDDLQNFLQACDMT